jgi:aspartyl-tRNA(Asn)/glutamyl-tRNA(Gln) amidotransferase subunit C
MQIDQKTVHKIATLSRIEVKEEDVAKYQGSLNTILSWVEQLSEVNTDGVEPLTSVHIKQMPERADIINDGDQANCVLANAPEQELNMFAVPKVVE